MMDTLLSWLGRLPLSLRYRVRVDGLGAVVAKGRERILLLPNHPALIDPVILAVHLLRDLHPVFLADSQQIDRPVLRSLARWYGVRALPDVKELGASARGEVERALTGIAAELGSGKNVVLYPSGHLYRTAREDLRGNSAAMRLVETVPDLRVVLVRQTGLWGSAFSWADGAEPSAARALSRGARGLSASGLVFAPRRPVRIELVEPDDLPRGSREELNAYLERFYNDGAPPNTYVPYSVWERSERQTRPEPLYADTRVDTSAVPAATRKLVLAHLAERTGRSELHDTDELARKLGLDSLARAELLVYIEQELGVPVASATTLETVGDVLLAACGEATSRLPRRVKAPPAAWKRPSSNRRVAVPASVKTLTEAFLAVAERGLSRPLFADQNSGMRTVADVLTAVFVLKDRLRSLPGEHLGLLLPASVGAAVTFLATLFAEKTPVMVNFTAGERAMLHGLDTVGVERVVTSKLLVATLEARGTELGAVKERLVYLEDLVADLSPVEKVRAAVRARVDRGALARIRPREHAVVLFTSGSESLPKAVPLTHANLLANLRDGARVLTLREDDVLLGMLPPFHSFGLTVGIGLALAGGVRVAYHPDPTDAGMLARLAEAYGATLLVGTPTFVGGIVRAATRDELATVRLAVTGAEACPERTYAAIRERCPRAIVLEGYGITECSPIVAINDERAPRPLTVGKVLPSVEYAVVDPESGVEVARGERGMLLVRGPSIFGGYLNPTGTSPFVEHAGRSWYRTGDLVTEDEERVLTFRGRLQRFVKLGGEMVSLPAIESVLEPAYPPAEGERGPVLAVVSQGSDDRPELVLCIARDVERATVNDHLRAAGLSPLHQVRRVVRVAAIPVLGTGKTDYRALTKSLADVDPPRHGGDVAVTDSGDIAG